MTARRNRQSLTLALATLALALLSLASAALAQAAPVLDVDIAHKRSVLPPSGSGEFRVSVVNSGDEGTSDDVEVTVTLPAGLSATSASDGSGFDFWDCSIAAGGASVSCEGPNLAPELPPGGMDVCIYAGLSDPCPITIAVDVAPDAPRGPAQVLAEACGGDAVPECSSASDDVTIGNFGDQVGIAPINGHPDAGADQAPALPGNHAFWAGTCDTGLAPEPPAFVAPPGTPPAPTPITDPTGFGAMPQSVWVPDPTLFSGSSLGRQFEVPAPRFPAQCVDWGRMAPQGQPAYPKLWRDPEDWPGEPPPDGVPPWGTFGGGPPSWRLPAVTQAGGHADGTATAWFNRNDDGVVDGTVDNVYAFLPAGFVGAPTAVPKCTADQFATKPLGCPPESQVGVMRLYLAAATLQQNYPGSNEEILPVYNLEPRKGRLAELGIAYVSGEDATTVRLTAKARTDGDFGVTALVGQIPAALPLLAQSITVWGVPWASEHDVWRPPAGWRPPQGPGFELVSRTGEIPPTGVPEADRVGYEPEWGSVEPLLSNPTECTGGELQTLLGVDSYEHPGAFDGEGDPVVDLDTPDEDGSASNWHTYGAAAPPVTGCDKPGFAPDVELAPSSRIADSPSGLGVELTIPQNDDLPFDPPAEDAPQDEIDDYLAAAVAHWRSDAGVASSQLDRAVVKLPEGVSVNPSGATGLDGCSDEQIGVTNAGSSPMRFNNGDPFDKDGGDGAECPDASKIGTVEVDTPLLDEPLTGEVVLGTPKSTDPASGQMFRLFVVARLPERGLIAKIAGSTVADPSTGQLTTTFDKNPRVPFETMRLQLKAGERGLLALPQQCGTRGWIADFTPWTAAHGAGGTAAAVDGGFVADERCGFGFSPSLVAGTSPRQGGGSGAFTFQIARQDGEQWLRDMTVDLPTGLLASLRGVPLCSNAQANADACPAGSRIGTVDAAAGSGDPFVLERKGSVYLTEGYKGAPYGLAVSVPVEAGPFRGQWALSPIVVRQALHVDRTTAEVTAVTDPVPLVHHGIPLRTRRVTVVVDRPGFMRNPSSCARKEIAATIGSPQGATATPRQPFQASGCAGLRFKPKLTLRLTGRKQLKTGKHPGVKAAVTQKAGEADIAKAVVRLPGSLALDPDNAQALCEFADGTKPDIESRCPKGSIVGRAKAVSPLLNRPLTGNVYFVKNVRIDPRTGNQIRTLPMIVVALRGEIAINLRGESSTTKNGRLVNTFANVPDAPVSSFNLNIAGGKNGILTVTRTRRARIDICRSKRQIAEADIDGHNGRRADQDVRIKTPCPKKKAKRKARS